jgi:hypothetical protein
VRITPTGDGGTEFFFPPMRGAANSIFQTVVFVVTVSLFVLFCVNGQPSIRYFAVAGVWGAIELGFFMWILRLWFVPEQVVVANGLLSHTYGIFGRTRTMTTAEINSIRVTKGDYTKHYAIRIVGAGLHIFTVGDGIRLKRDAEWLAQQMSQAAGVKAADSIPGSSETEIAENLKAVEALVQSNPLARTFLAGRMDDVSEIVKDEKGATAGNLPSGAVDIQPAATAAATYRNPEDARKALADAIVSRAYGVPSPSQIQTRGPFRGAAKFIGLLTIVALALWIYRAMVISGHLHGH